jgi:hypothetical protein
MSLLQLQLCNITVISIRDLKLVHLRLKYPLRQVSWKSFNLQRNVTVAHTVTPVKDITNVLEKKQKTKTFTLVPFSCS